MLRIRPEDLDPGRFARILRKNEGNLKNQIRHTLTDFGSAHRPFSVSMSYAEALRSAVALDLETLGTAPGVPVLSAGVAYGRDLTETKSLNRAEVQKVMEEARDIFFKPEEFEAFQGRPIDFQSKEDIRKLVGQKADWFDPTTLVKGPMKDRLLDELIESHRKGTLQGLKPWIQGFLEEESARNSTILVHNLNFEASMLGARFGPQEFTEKIGKSLQRYTGAEALYENLRLRIYSTSPETFNAARLARSRPNYETYRTLFQNWSKHLEAKTSGAKFLDTMDLAASVVGMAEHQGYANKVNYYGSIKMEDYLQARFGLSELHMGSADAHATLFMTNDLLHVGRKLEKGEQLDEFEASLVKTLSEAKQDKTRRISNHVKTFAADLQRLKEGKSVRISLLEHQEGSWQPVEGAFLSQQVRKEAGKFEAKREFYRIPRYERIEPGDKNALRKLMDHTDKRLGEAQKDIQGEVRRHYEALGKRYQEAIAGGETGRKAAEYIKKAAVSGFAEETQAKLAAKMDHSVNAGKLGAIIAGAGVMGWILSKTTEPRFQGVSGGEVGGESDGKSVASAVGTLAVGTGTLALSADILKKHGLGVKELIRETWDKPSGKAYLGGLLGAVSAITWASGSSAKSLISDSGSQGNLLWGGIGAIGTLYLTNKLAEDISPKVAQKIEETAGAGSRVLNSITGMAEKVMEDGKKLMVEHRNSVSRVLSEPKMKGGIALIGAGALILGSTLFGKSKPEMRGLSNPYNEMGGINSSNDPRWQSGTGEGSLVYQLGKTNFTQTFQSVKKIMSGGVFSDVPKPRPGIPSVKVHPSVPQPKTTITQRVFPEKSQISEPRFISRGPLQAGADTRLRGGQARANLLSNSSRKHVSLDNVRSKGIIEVGKTGAKGHMRMNNAKPSKRKTASANSYSCASMVK